MDGARGRMRLGFLGIITVRPKPSTRVIKFRESDVSGDWQEMDNPRMRIKIRLIGFTLQRKRLPGKCYTCAQIFL